MRDIIYSMFTIVSAPNPILSQKTKKVPKIDSSILRLVEEMKETLDKTLDPEGVGLAAPQVGKSVQIFIMKPTPKSPVTVCINPLVEPKREPQATEETGLSAHALAKAEPKAKSSSSKKLEGCLSLYSIWGEVVRKREITISYLDEKGKSHVKTFKRFPATIVQHEMDHLNGILFPKRVLEQKGILYKSRKNEKGEDIFEEIEI